MLELVAGPWAEVEVLVDDDDDEDDGVICTVGAGADALLKENGPCGWDNPDDPDDVPLPTAELETVPFANAEPCTS